MPSLTIISTGEDVICMNCAEEAPGVIIRKVGDPRNRITLCGRCLALALQEVTKQNWLSQYVLWQANSALGKQIRQEKRNAPK